MLVTQKKANNLTVPQTVKEANFPLFFIIQCTERIDSMLL